MKHCGCGAAGDGVLMAEPGVSLVRGQTEQIRLKDKAEFAEGHTQTHTHTLAHTHSRRLQAVCG